MTLGVEGRDTENMFAENNSEQLYFIILDDMIEIAQYEGLIKVLPEEKQNQIRKFHFDIDKKLSLLSDMFVRYLACSLMHVKNSDLIFKKNKYGKPYIEGTMDFHYNISHTRNAIAVGISRKPIGIDVEKIKDYESEISKQFFSKNELQYIMYKEENISRRFYEIWTKKEAYIKWVGKGLYIPLATFDVLSKKLDCKIDTILTDDYLVSVCTCSEHAGYETIKLNEQSVYQSLLRFGF